MVDKLISQYEEDNHIKLYKWQKQYIEKIISLTKDNQTIYITNIPSRTGKTIMLRCLKDIQEKLDNKE
jgi:AAA+ ATPase superfamily predicted ATPase